ncbi:MAG: sodium:solute symporter family protein [Calditrichae bacterium]|nr:sodium:solute symporter family protein [Calditrichia bacterium]
MHIIDFIIFGVYFSGVLAVGIYFYLKNESREDYYVGGRSISANHVGLSIVATDVGGGFSIGLGGLGFTMGLSGSWLLFSGLLGAWLAAVFTVPRLKKMDMEQGMYTYPDFLERKFNKYVALVAAMISGIGYLGFTSAQILAGAKLAAGSFFQKVSFMDPLNFSLYVMAGIILIYTVLGGIKAVIYTDTIQWIVLLSGLVFLGIPFAIYELGGWDAIQAQLPDGFLSLTNISFSTFTNWLFTIVPIWFIAMTLYQRVFSCSNIKEAKKAFFIAGVFEYPIMAFMGVSLGMMGRIAFPDVDSEMALPMLLKDVLPIGVTGFVLASYFSAIMSTADSCLIASSGNFVNDLIEKHLAKNKSDTFIIRISQIVTLLIGLLAMILAGAFKSVLDIILHAYAFMVAGLFIPTLFAYFSKKPNALAAMLSMLGGGSTAVYFIASPATLPFNLDKSVPGILASALIYIVVSFFNNRK